MRKRLANARRLLALGTACTAAVCAFMMVGDPASGVGAPSLQPIKIALYPSTDYAALYVGIEKGVFKRYGLAPHITDVLTGTGLTAAVTSGSADIGTNSPTSMVTGISHGLPVKLVALADAVPKKGYVGVLVNKSSGITSWKGLAGKQVATINLEGLFDLGVRTAVQKAGGNPLSVHSLALAPTDEAPALSAGRVQGIVLQDPFLAQALTNPKFRSLGNPFAQFSYSVPIGAFWASNTVVKKKAALLNKFRQAYAAATALVRANPQLARHAITTYTSLTKAQAATIGLPIYTSTVSKSALATMAGQMKAYGWISSAPSYSQVVWTGK